VIKANYEKTEGIDGDLKAYNISGELDYNFVEALIIEKDVRSAIRSYLHKVIEGDNGYEIGDKDFDNEYITIDRIVEKPLKQGVISSLLFHDDDDYGVF